MLNAKELVKEIQEMRDQGFLSDALLRHAAKSIKSSDDRYDWVGVFLLREGGEELWLHNYLGEPADRATIQVGTGVGGLAVSEGTNKNVPDLGQVEGYVPVSPDAQSQLVVLIRAGDEIFGQFDLDSEEVGTFTAEDEEAVQAVMDKLAEQLMAERR